ncbi:gastrula zinc finger protein XlCGF26.1-like [Pararge aegeria]|uniref:gastrula zinc finger protein XlCGF26.1-like n=1 Tax=Pararge aegeria TaxID=116150 RepID=UPI0019D28969|nr:gastrula zinc finger protein XlCGF26.1-like [Pararge aegeria]
MDITPETADPETVLTDTCRVCLLKVAKATYLFSAESIDILEKLHSCFQLTLTYKKYLPSVICDSCIEELNIAYNFRQKCVSIEERFSILIQITDHNEDNNIDDPVELKDDISEKVEILKHDSEDKLSGIQEISKINYSVEKDTFLCTLCNKALKSEASLAKHNVSMHQKRKHLGKVTGFGPDRRYHCTKCSYCTPHSQTLVNHMRRHNGDRPYCCHCGKTFTQASSLNAHRKTHSNTTYFTCTICGKQFKHAFTLKKHLNVHGAGKFLCDICNKQLKSRQSLQDHMYRHYNIRNYNCEDCGDTFVTHSELLNHKKKHGMIKRVECHLCGYKTHTKKTLIIHLKRHAGDKSFKCGLCQITFYTNGDLQRHARVHTHEKPYPCPVCTQKFAHSTSLNKHMNTVHGIKFKWADVKGKELGMEKSSKFSWVENVIKQ